MESAFSGKVRADEEIVCYIVCDVGCLMSSRRNMRSEDETTKIYDKLYRGNSRILFHQILKESEGRIASPLSLSLRQIQQHPDFKEK